MANAEHQRPAFGPARPKHPTPLVGEDAESSELRALLEGAARGDQEAWRRIVGMYGRRVFAMARSRRLRPDAAEEVTQSVFATVAIKLRESGGYEEQGRFESWLFRITINRVRDEIRRLQRHAEPTDPIQFQQLAGRTPGADAVARGEASGELESLRDALNELSDADRDVIELRHHAGLEFKRIAEILGQPLGTVLARHHRALRKLKQFLESGTPENES